MTAPVEGCCHSAKNPRIGERVGVGGLFRVLDCCAGGLARLVGVSSVPKRQRKIAERMDVDVLGKLEGKPAMLAGSYNAVRARGAATQPGTCRPHVAASRQHGMRRQSARNVQAAHLPPIVIS